MPQRRKIPHKSDTWDSMEKNTHSEFALNGRWAGTSLFMAVSPHTSHPKTSPHAVSHFDFPETLFGVKVMSYRQRMVYKKGETGLSHIWKSCEVLIEEILKLAQISIESSPKTWRNLDTFRTKNLFVRQNASQFSWQLGTKVMNWKSEREIPVPKPGNRAVARNSNSPENICGQKNSFFFLKRESGRSCNFIICLFSRSVTPPSLSKRERKIPWLAGMTSPLKEGTKTKKSR